MSYFFWGIENDNDVIIIDTGFCEHHIRNRNIEVSDFYPSEALLGSAAINPEEVKTLIITHLHWDHCSAIGLFKNARIICQRDDFEFFNNPLVREIDPIAEFVDYNAIDIIAELKKKNQITLVDGDCKINQSIELIKLPGHTPGSQGVRVRGKKKSIFICGDSVPFYKNFENGIASGIYVNLVDFMFSLGKLKRVVEKGDIVVPGHDPTVLEYFVAKGGVATLEI